MVTVGLFILIAGMATVVLWKMHTLYNRLAHRDATMTVIESGRLITSGLARDIAENQVQDVAVDWPVLSRMVKALAASEDQLQFVTVMQDGVTVFHEQVRPVVGDYAVEWESQLSPELVAPSRQMLKLGTNTLPIVLFSLPFENGAEKEYVVNVGLRKGAIVREEQAVANVIQNLSRLTLITVVVSFATTALVILWMLFREKDRDKQRRSEEHLAYAGVMASGIVHDFRNPMSSLRLDVQMLRKQAARGAQCDLGRVDQLAVRICKITDRMEKVFRQFLFLSRPGDSKPEPLNVVAVLRDCMGVAQPRMDAAGVRLECRGVEGTVELVAYTEALRRALLNVLMNAEQHAGEDGRVLLRLEQTKKSVVIHIANTGDVIPREKKKSIFELFYTTRPGGTGLGLFLARAALERNGGRIEITEEAGYATCFRIELPLQAPLGRKNKRN